MELFGTHGFLGTSIGQIASAAGVSKSGLLHHFDSKEEVFRQVFHRAEAELVKRSVDGVTDDMSPKQQLRTGARSLLRALDDEGLRQIVLVDGPAVLGWLQWRQIEAEYAHGLVVDIFKRAAERHELAVEPTAAAAAILLAALHEAAFVANDHTESSDDASAVFDHLLCSLFIEAP